MDGNHACCRLSPVQREYVPCGTVCCCTNRSFGPQYHQFAKRNLTGLSRSLVDIEPEDRKDISPPMEVKPDEPTRFYLDDMMVELKELNKHFRKYFRKKKKSKRK